MKRRARCVRDVGLKLRSCRADDQRTASKPEHGTVDLRMGGGDRGDGCTARLERFVHLRIGQQPDPGGHHQFPEIAVEVELASRDAPDCRMAREVHGIRDERGCSVRHSA